ncbi:hypothetical protein KP509_07G005200 [Ceratopteris richardii]|uniref:Uncharacterized protein n=1 Tax=Ceratopteris richardii TaxID=49495 RepID=A0A8T2UDS3_CERRI|nr:hypothetical protein KP509_07G005200 [Ceratopteris richardii]
MKFLSWASKKLLSSNGIHDNQFHGSSDFYAREGKINEIIAGQQQFVMCIEQEESRTFSVDQGHSEIFRIGTLGVGDLLTRNSKEAETSEDEEDEDEFIVQYEEDGCEGMQERLQVEQEYSEGAAGSAEEGGLYRTSSGTESSMSSRRSTSSSCESEASFDIQKLQEEMRQILHFQPVPEKQQPKASTKRSTSIEFRKTKQNNLSSENNVVDDANALAHLSRSSQNTKVDGRNASSKQNSKGNNSLSKAQNESSTSLRRKHCSLLMQSIRSKILNSTAPTHVNIARPIFESLLKANGGYDLPQQSSTISKVVNLCRRIVNRKRNVARKRWKHLASYDHTEHVSWYNLDAEKEIPNWAIAKSHRGSERFIDYITNILAQMDNMNEPHTLSGDRRSFSHEINRYNDDVHAHNNAKRSAETSIPYSESWIDTDDESFSKICIITNL